MSDEPTPSPTPSLRLKPRLRSDAPATPPPVLPKIAIAQPLEADGVLSAGERKVFSAPAPEPSAETAAVSDEPQESQPKKLSLTPKLTADAKTKRFSLPAANPTAGLKRLPAIAAEAASPAEGDANASQDEDVHLGPTSYAKGEAGLAAHAREDAVASATTEAPTTDDRVEESTSEEKTDSSDAGTSSATGGGPDHGEALSSPHPEAGVPTRFSPPPSENADSARFKLKPRLSAPENPPAHGGVSLPPALPNASHPSPPPGIKIVPTAPNGPATGSLPAKVALQPRPSANGTRQLRRVVVKSGKPRILKYFLIGFGLLAGGGLAIGGFIGFRYLAQLEKHPANEQPPLVVHVPAKKLILPSKSTGPQSAAGRLVEQAKAAANSEIEEIDSTSETAIKAATSTAAPKAATPAAANPATASASTVATTATAAAPAKPVVPEGPKVVLPSAEFRSLIVNMRVSGVFQGAHPRALLNGRLLNAGEVLDQTLQVRFTGIDVPHKLLLFEDGAGALMQRHY